LFDKYFVTRCKCEMFVMVSGENYVMIKTVYFILLEE